MTNDPIRRFSRDREAHRELMTTLRPTSPGGLMDRALRLYQRNGLFILGRTATPTVFALAAWAFFTSFAMPRIGALLGSEGGSFEGVVAILATLFVALPIFVLGVAWNVSIVIEVTHRAMRGEPIDNDEISAGVLKRLVPMALVIGRTLLLSNSVSIASSLLIALGSSKSASAAGIDGELIGFGVFGLFVGFFFSAIGFGKGFLAPSVLVIERRKSTREVIQRCRKLTGKGLGVPSATDGLLVMLVTIVIIYLALVGGFAISMEVLSIDSFVRDVTPVGPILTVLLEVVNLAPMFFALWTIIPTWGLFSTCLYFDRRVRLEAYDIDALAAFIPPTPVR